MQPELYTLNSLKSGKLSIMAHPRGGDWLEDEVKGWTDAGVRAVVSLLTRPEIVELNLTDEPELCRARGLEYFSLPIIDRAVPDSSKAALELLQPLAKYLVEGKHVAVHCRMGIGRSALIAASLLVLSGYQPERAFELIQQVRGRPVPDTEEQRQWVENFAEGIK